MLKHNKNSKILGMILTRLITNPSMSLSIKDQIYSPNMILTWILGKTIKGIIEIIIDIIFFTLNMILGTCFCHPKHQIKKSILT